MQLEASEFWFLWLVSSFIAWDMTARPEQFVEPTLSDESKTSLQAASMFVNPRERSRKLA